MSRAGFAQHRAAERAQRRAAVLFSRAGTALAAFLLSAGTLVVAADAARDYPGARPIRLVSPFAAGGSTDQVGRLIAPRLGERLGANIIVENRPGAGGMIGTSHVAKGTPDGHTLLFISGAFVAHSAVTKNLPYVVQRHRGAKGHSTCSGHAPQS